MNTIDEPASRVESPAEAPLQAASQDIWEQKYHLRGRLGKPVERDIDHCYQRIADTIDDSMANILRKLYEADITLKSGAGIGYEFSTLRPRGAHVTSGRCADIRAAGVSAHTGGTRSRRTRSSRQQVGDLARLTAIFCTMAARKVKPTTE